MLSPRPVQAGDRVIVVAPSGPFDEVSFQAGLRKLERHFEVVVPEALSGRKLGFLAGTDAERRSELQQAMDDPLARAIWVARGGYGISRILPGLNWARMTTEPCWIIGFSDTTTLHLAAWSRGIASLHAPHVTGLADMADATFNDLLQLLGSPNVARTYEALTVYGPPASAPVIQGPIVGGNLTVLFAEAAAGRLSLPEGCLLMLEDVSETSYRVDRMLTALAEHPALHHVRAILLGDFTDCSPGRFEVATSDVLVERLLQLGRPVAFGLPVGHGEPNLPLLLGCTARLDLRRGSLSVGAPALDRTR